MMITKENITIAALRLFLVRGYKYVSLMDVANEVGVTKGGIYYYFSSKEELLNVAVNFLFDRFEEKYMELFSPTKSLQESLRALIVDQELERYTDGLLGIRGDYRISYANFALEVMRRFPNIQERVDRSHLDLSNAIEQKVHMAVEKGEIRGDLDNHSLAIIILSVLGGQHSLGNQLKTPGMRYLIFDNIWKLISIC